MKILKCLCCASIICALLCNLRPAFAQVTPATGKKAKAPEVRIEDRMESGAGEPKSFTWKSAGQEEACGKHLLTLGEYYMQSRNYSIQGDSCSSAVYARKFLDLERRIHRECPPEYLSRNGCSEPIVREIRSLEALEAERCFGSAEPYRPARASPKASRKIVPPPPSKPTP